MLYHKRILGQSNFFLKQNPTEANLTIDDLKQMITSDSYEPLISKLMHYSKNVCGTNAYWNRAKDDLKAIITQVGAPTIFGLFHVLNSIGLNFMIFLTMPIICHMLNVVKMSSIILIYLIVFLLKEQNSL